MINQALRGAILSSALLLSSASLALAQSSQPQIKRVTIQKTSVTSGAEMFNEYCAVCHGPTGKGDGPAASALKIPPANLTTLSQRHGGKFPDSYVVTVLDSGVHEAKAHGSKDMPIWGALFGSISSGQSSASQEVKLRISNMSDYLKTLQTM